MSQSTEHITPLESPADSAVLFRRVIAASSIEEYIGIFTTGVSQGPESGREYFGATSTGSVLSYTVEEPSQETIEICSSWVEGATEGVVDAIRAVARASEKKETPSHKYLNPYTYQLDTPCHRWAGDSLLRGVEEADADDGLKIMAYTASGPAVALAVRLHAHSVAYIQALRDSQSRGISDYPVLGGILGEKNVVPTANFNLTPSPESPAGVAYAVSFTVARARIALAHYA